MSKQKKQDNLTYSEKMAIIRPFVDFNYKKIGHSSQKAKINRYWKALNEMQGQAVSRYKPQKKNRAKIRKATGTKLKGFTTFLIPSEKSGQKVRVKYKKGKAVIKTGKTERQLFSFNSVELVFDAESEVERVLDLARDAEFEFCSIATGYFEYYQFFRVNDGKTFEYILAIIRAMIEAYGEDNVKAFCRGIYGLNFADGNTWKDYLKAKEEFRRKTKVQKRRMNMGKNGKKKTHHSDT